MDRTGRIDEVITEAKPKAPPPSAEGKDANPAPDESLRPSGNHNPSDTHPPEDPAKTSAA